MEIKDISTAIVELEEDDAIALVDQAIELGMDAIEILDGIMEGLKEIGDLFGSGQYYLSDLLIGGKLVDECVTNLSPYLPKTEGLKKGVVILGAVEGDLHDIGYTLVGKYLELGGYDVHKIGINVPAMTFVEKAKEYGADIIGLSALLVTTIHNCDQVINILVDLGIRDNYKVIVGGAETNQSFSDSIGADGWAANAADAVTLCDKLMGHA